PSSWMVVKLYSPAFTTPSFVEAFRTEAESWSRIAGIHGVGAAELGRVGQALYRASPYFPSKDVQKILTKCFHAKRRTPPALALEIAAQAALILDEVRKSTGWLHRSVRPAHVLIGYQGQVRLLDFGASKDAITVPPESPLGLFYLSYS